MVDHPVDVPGWRQGDVTRREFLLLGSDGDPALPFQQIIYIFRPLVGMNFLSLAGFETVYITKKPVRIEKADLVHFLGFKLHLIADFDDFHMNPNPFDNRGVNLGDGKSL